MTAAASAAYIDFFMNFPLSKAFPQIIRLKNHKSPKKEPTIPPPTRRNEKAEIYSNPSASFPVPRGRLEILFALVVLFFKF